MSVVCYFLRSRLNASASSKDIFYYCFKYGALSTRFALLSSSSSSAVSTLSRRANAIKLPKRSDNRRQLFETGLSSSLVYVILASQEQSY